MNGHQRHGRKSSLLTGIATKVADTRDWKLTGYDIGNSWSESLGTFAWLDDHRLLFFRTAGQNPTRLKITALANVAEPSHSIELNLFDTRTKTRKTVTTLQQQFNRSYGVAAWLKLSPDGKWLAWPNSLGTATVASFDGKTVYSIAPPGGDVSDNSDVLQ